MRQIAPETTCPLGCLQSPVTMIDNRFELVKPIYTCSNCEARWQYELTTRVVLIDGGKNDIPDLKENDWDKIARLMGGAQ